MVHAMKRIFVILPVVLFLGTGCTLPWMGRESFSDSEPLCLAWGTAEGFRAWITAYEHEDTRAVALAKNIRLSGTADKKLMGDLHASLDAGGTPTFLCTLDARGRHVVWVMEYTEEITGSCTDSFYVSIGGTGTTSDFSTQPAADCSQLCKPKRLEENLLVWQCDVRETEDGHAAWSQLHMNRHTGEATILNCQEDHLDLPRGCVR